MPISEYVGYLRTLIGPKALLTPGVDALVYNDAGQPLRVKRSDNGFWEVPGGQLDPLEPPALGMIHEVFEETGLRVAPVALSDIFGGSGTYCIRYPDSDEVNPIVAFFSCRSVGVNSATVTVRRPLRSFLHLMRYCSSSPRSRVTCWQRQRRKDFLSGTRAGWRGSSSSIGLRFLGTAADSATKGSHSTSRPKLVER